MNQSFNKKSGLISPAARAKQKAEQYRAEHRRNSRPSRSQIGKTAASQQSARRSRPKK